MNTQQTSARLEALADLRVGVEMDAAHMDDGRLKLEALDAAMNALRASLPEPGVVSELPGQWRKDALNYEGDVRLMLETVAGELELRLQSITPPTAPEAAPAGEVVAYVSVGGTSLDFERHYPDDRPLIYGDTQPAPAAQGGKAPECRGEGRCEACSRAAGCCFKGERCARLACLCPEWVARSDYAPCPTAFAATAQQPVSVDGAMVMLPRQLTDTMRKVLTDMLTNCHSVDESYADLLTALRSGSQPEGQARG